MTVLMPLMPALTMSIKPLIASLPSFFIASHISLKILRTPLDRLFQPALKLGPKLLSQSCISEPKREVLSCILDHALLRFFRVSDQPRFQFLLKFLLKSSYHLWILLPQLLVLRFISSKELIRFFFALDQPLFHFFLN